MKKITLIIFLLMAMVISVNADKKPKKHKVNQQPVQVDSMAIILEKAKNGDAAAQNTVGVWYYTGKDSIRQDYREAVTWWARAAQQDNADAIGNMAMCYQLGRGVERDSAMAMGLYEAAVKKGNASIIPQHEAIVKNTKSLFSSLLLNRCYTQGIGVPRNQEKAMEYLTIAAEGGHEQSQFSLGLYYLNKKQADKAVGWFQKSAAQGNTAAIYHYGHLLFVGQGIAQDKQKGIQYMEIAAKKDYAVACYQLGSIYLSGDGVEKDAVKAVAYLKTAVAKKNMNAMWLLANCYQKGEGVSQDYYLATQWYAEVALLSHKKQFSEMLAQDNDGTYSMYLKGLRNYFIDKDYKTAIDYFKKVEKADNVEGETMYALCLANKDYEKRNLKKAIKRLKEAAETSPVANYYLAVMYETGTGVDKDANKAIELLTKAADAGIAYAQSKLGDCYMTGNGVVKDPTKAAQLYLLAEAQNHLTPESAKNLAACYQMKLACLPDVADAENRMAKLNKQGNNVNLLNMLRLIEK